MSAAFSSRCLLPFTCQQELKFFTINNCRYKSTSIRIIVRKDLPNNRAFLNDVVHVKAGYARNFLIPQKYGVYATRHNFERLGITDPERMTAAEAAAASAKAAVSSSPEQRAADVLKHYFRNKRLKIIRNVDPTTKMLFPGMVDATAVREKLSKQLGIDLEKHEEVHLLEKRLEPIDLVLDPNMLLDSRAISPRKQKLIELEALDKIVHERFGPPDVPCTVQIRELGEFVARITLKGGYMIALRFEVVKR